MKYKVKGIIYYTNYTVILRILQTVFIGISVKPRIFGFDIKYLDDIVELYITTTENDEKEYYVDITISSEIKFLEVKKTLKYSLLSEDILFDLGFIVEDANWQEIEEEQFIHPDFVKRYIPPC
jgi:uncharacterized pyridoxamine 5'-phosphate oxidase family protein